MCLASAWLATVLDRENLGASDQFFRSMTTESKPSRVILPVFFGQADACLTSKAAFDTMCELNPQVGRELAVVASSPALVAVFYAFHKNYHAASRERFARIFANATSTAAGRQLGILFDYRQLTVRDAGVLAPGLAILDCADRLRRERGTGGPK
jgi:phosphonate transport system substrate-binding protein